MSLSIGTLVGYLSLDDTNFNRKADNADRKINGLKLHLDALSKSNPKLKLEVEAQTKALEDVQARIVALKAQAAQGIDVRVDMVAALVELDRLQTKLREMHNAEIKVHVDDAGALAKLDALQRKVDGFGSKGGLFGSAMAFSPAFLPAVNALPGALFAIGSGAVASAGGIGVLALAFHGLGDSVKAYSDYEAKLPFAKNAKQIADLKKTLDLSAYGEQNTQGRTFTRLVATKGAAAGSGIKSAAQAGVFPGATRALRDILPLVPTIERLMRSLGHTVGDMTDEAAKALNSPFWRQWFHWLGQDARTQLPLVGSIFGNFFKGLMQGIERFSPQGTSMLKWLDDLSRKFSNWTGSPQFDKFMATTAEDAHLVGQALRPLGKILAEMYAGMSGTGTVELQLLGEVLRGMAHLPPGVFQVIGATLPVIFLGLKAVALTSSIVTGIKGLASAFIGLAEAEGAAAGAGKAAMVAAGLLIVANASDRTSRSMGALQGAAGGALSGAGIGMFAGPEGAAIGAGVGAIAGGLYGLVRATKKSGSTAVESTTDWTTYASTLNQVTGAITGATRAAVYQNLQQKGLLASANAAGISNREAVSAAMGNKKAQEDLTHALATTTEVTDAQFTAWRNELPVLDQAAQKVRDQAAATQDFGNKLKGMPKALQVAVTTNGLDHSIAGVAALQAEFKLTPKQVRVLMGLAGFEPTKHNIQTVTDLARTYGRLVAKGTVGVNGAPQAINQLKYILTLMGAVRGSKVKGLPPDGTLGGVVGRHGAHGHGSPPDPTFGGILGPATAMGGTVPGQRTPYGDKTLTPTAPGEEIISNSHGQADRNRDALKAANAGALIAVVGMAGGGTVGDPLAGFGPEDVPGAASSSHHHHSKKKSAAHAKAEHDKRLRAKLAAENKALTQAKAALAAAQNWSSAFAGNPFSADLSPYMTTANSSPVTSIINGMKVVQSGGTTAATPQSTLAAMLSYQQAQKTQADNLSKWVAKLRREGVSAGVLGQMQSAGPQGIAEIQALASGSLADVRRFNSLSAGITGSLNNTGAYATTGHSYTELQRQQMSLQTIIKALSHALGKPVPVRVIGSSLRI